MTTATGSNSSTIIEVLSYEEIFPYRSLYERIDNLTNRLPHSDALGELSYIFLKSSEFVNLDPIYGSSSHQKQPNNEVRTKLASCKIGGTGTVVLKGVNTQIPPDVFDSVMLLSTHLEMNEVHAIALYVEAASYSNASDACRKAVEIYYEERIQLLSALLNITPLLGDNNVNDMIALRRQLLDSQNQVKLVDQMLSIILKYAPLYTESSKHSQSNEISFFTLKDNFYKNVLMFTSSILFYLYLDSANSMDDQDIENIKSIITSLRTLATSINDSIKFVTAKLLLTCLNVFSIDYDSFPGSNPVLNYVSLLSDFNSWCGKTDCGYIYGALNSSYAIYLDAVSNAGQLHVVGLHVDELNRFIREAYELNIFSRIRTEILPSISSADGGGNEDHRIFIAVLVNFVNRFTTIANSYNDIPMTQAQWELEQEYDSQLNNIQGNTSAKEDVLEDIVLLIIELCKQRHECASGFFCKHLNSEGKVELVLSEFLQGHCLLVLSSELACSLLVALAYEEGIIPLHSFLKSSESQEVNWGKLFEIISKYNQQKYYSSFNSNSTAISAKTDAFLVKLILALIARCAINNDVRTWLLNSSIDVLQLVFSAPINCVEKYFAMANLMQNDKSVVRVLEWIDSEVSYIHLFKICLHAYLTVFWIIIHRQ